MKALNDAVDALNQRVYLAQSIVKSLELASGDNSPAWVHVFEAQIEAISEAAEVLEKLALGRNDANA